MMLIGWDLTRGSTDHDAANAAQPQSSQNAARVASPAADIVPVVVDQGPGTFHFATGQSAVTSGSGPLQRYRVAVEDGIGVDPATFASAVDAILADPRSWIAGGNVRFQRVAGTAPAAFTVFLASPATSETMCREDWLETERFTNCRLASGKVVINSARWLTSVPNYGAALLVYRSYAVNHEVGHQLGHGHELCPGPGQPAPVMQQQTYGLKGCIANAWPYLDGERYHGPVASQ